MEINAPELGWKPLSAKDVEVRAILQNEPISQIMTVDRRKWVARVHRWAYDTVRAERAWPKTHAELAKGLKAVGFRFPTSDEWEYACGGSEQTLYRWGDHVPSDRYPTDFPADVARRRERQQSGGQAVPSKGTEAFWELHRQPNAFGLLIAHDPYKLEVVAEIGTTRGGDGGAAIHGGNGFYNGWLPLATAFLHPDYCTYNLSQLATLAGVVCWIYPNLFRLPKWVKSVGAVYKSRYVSSQTEDILQSKSVIQSTRRNQHKREISRRWLYSSGGV